MVAFPHPASLSSPSRGWVKTVCGGRDGGMLVEVALLLLELHPVVVPMARPLARELPDVR